MVCSDDKNNNIYSINNKKGKTMNTQDLYPVTNDFAQNSLVNNDKYNEMYQQSITQPDIFWGEHGKRLDWIKPYTKVKETSFEEHVLF